MGFVPREPLTSKAKRAHGLCSSIRSRAKRNEIEFDLTPEDIQIPDVCPVLGIPIDIDTQGHGKTLDNAPSVDRIDPNKGYTKDNIIVVSWRANNLKANGTIEEFEKLLKWMKQNAD